MEKLFLLALAIGFAGFISVVHPSEHFACYTCSTNSLQMPEECAASYGQKNCSSNTSTCFAAAAELMNGTQIAIKDCYGWQENCSRITACEQGANMTDVTFKRCYATCCTTTHCNDMLHVLESTTSFINYSTPQAKSSSTHENRTTEKSTAPTSSSAVYKRISHLLVLLSVLPIAPYSIR
ncbi:PREDICTED: uncharacterized protein LOC107345572 [Acropora digitifera]|uniref:uncharacterized protein LOC107345572 n=1 Tax=Acropora digitifera TaxID=70779 RepID=UPI000779F836|nr:PREDICTED: uncharacterized protein LOC107345572 [Acropora digitifera]